MELRGPITASYMLIQSGGDLYDAHLDIGHPLALCTFQTAGPVRASTLYLSLALQDHRVKCRASRLKITVARSMPNFATFSCILFLKFRYVYCLTSVDTFLRKLFLTTLSSLCVISHEYKRRSGKNGGQ